jgi:hypothetical protein
MQSLFYKNLSKEKEFYFSHEIQVILCCSRSLSEKKNKEKLLSLLWKDLDWNFLIKTIEKHDVVPLVYQNLKLLDTNFIPQDVLDYFRTYSHKIALRNAGFLQELLSVLEVLNSNGIQAISFKGPVLALLAYRNIGLRSFCDLDILVRKQDFISACDLLISEKGYRASYELSFLNPKVNHFVVKSSHEYSLTNGITFIDLHQVLTVETFLSSGFTFEYLWSRLEVVHVAGQSIPSLGTEDLLLYLCIHGSKDCWRSLKWICDVSEFVNSHIDLPWSSVLEQAKKLGCERSLLLGLSLAQDILSLPLPDSVKARIRENRVVQQLTQEFTYRLFREDNNLGRAISIEKLILHWKLLDRLEDKLQFIKDINRHIYHLFVSYVLPREEDLKFFYLPRKLRFLYYIIRPTRLACRRLICHPSELSRSS